VKLFHIHNQRSHVVRVPDAEGDDRGTGFGQGHLGEERVLAQAGARLLFLLNSGPRWPGAKAMLWTLSTVHSAGLTVTSS
jgi:hypothetical protein